MGRRRTSRRAGIAIGLAALAALAASPAASAMRFGFNDDREGVAAAGNLVERSGAEIVRVPVYWPEIEPLPGDWRLGQVDSVYRRLARDGITPLFVVYGAPAHALPATAPGLRPSNGAPQNKEAWKELWELLARRYPEAVLQVWNEPNIWLYGSIPAAEAAELANLAAAAARSVDPRTVVIGPPAAPNQEWRPYMRDVYARTDPGIGVTVHLYPRVPPTWRQDFRSDLRFARRVAGPRRLWITESGLSRAQYGRRRQLRGSPWIFRRAAQAGVASLIFHRLVRSPGAGAWDRGLAVTDARTRPLPVFRALRRAARGTIGGR